MKKTLSIILAIIIIAASIPFSIAGIKAEAVSASDDGTATLTGVADFDLKVCVKSYCHKGSSNILLYLTNKSGDTSWDANIKINAEIEENAGIRSVVVTGNVEYTCAGCNTYHKANLKKASYPNLYCTDQFIENLHRVTLENGDILELRVDNRSYNPHKFTYEQFKANQYYCHTSTCTQCTYIQAFEYCSGDSNATCMKEGICSTCGEKYKDPKNHNKIDEWVQTAEEHYHNCSYGCTLHLDEALHQWYNGACKICGYPCGHNYKNYKCTNCKYECPHNFVNGECTDCGYVCSHESADEWITDNYRHHHECVYGCGVKQDTANHSFVNGVCSVCDFACSHNYDTNTQKCYRCGKKCPHNYELTFEFAPSCSAQGLNRFKCSDCGDEYNEILDSTGHDNTYTYTDTHHSAYCKICNQTSNSSHDYSKSCVCICGRVSDKNYDHNYTYTYTAPTCTEDGYYIYSCTDCGNSYKEIYGSKTGHWGGIATCTEKAVCVRCGEQYGDNPKGHSNLNDDGNCLTPINCWVCGEITTPANAEHIWDEDDNCINCSAGKPYVYRFTDGETELFTETVEANTYYYFEFTQDKGDYAFIGWDADSDGVADYLGVDLPSYVYVDGNRTFNAIYQEIDYVTIRYYRIGLDSGEYEISDIEHWPVNTAFNLDYDFAYWYTPIGWSTEKYGEKVYDFGEEIVATTNLDLYTVYEPFTVTFDLGEGASWLDENGNPVPETLTQNTEFYTAPTKAGFRFVHFTAVDQYGNEYIYDFYTDEETGSKWMSVFISGNATLTAVWEECAEHKYVNGKCDCGFSCDHAGTLVQIEGKEATCTESGYNTYEYCTACSYTTYKAIPATNHKNPLVQAEGKAATCTEAGFEPYEYCTACDYTTYKVIPANDHAPLEAVIENNVEPKCETAGSYDLVVYCGECDTELDRETVSVDALNHKNTLVQAEGKAATCTETGYKAYEYCTACDYTTYEEIGTVEHSPAQPVKENVVAPQCGTAGSYDLVINCNECGTVLGRETIATDELTHKDNDGDYLCDNGCGYEYEKPSEPDTPDGSDVPDENENVCDDCEEEHKNFFDEVICRFGKVFKPIVTWFTTVYNVIISIFA